MHSQIIDFIKKNLLISALLSIAIAILFFEVIPNIRSWVTVVLVGLSFFGLCALGVILLGIYFPKFYIKDYVEYCDPKDYVTVYFYDGYVNGFSRVTKLYGNVNDIENMSKSFSFIDIRGVYITDKWFYAVGSFVDNRVVVCLGNYQYNIMDSNGNLICKKNYMGMSMDISDGKVKVADGKGGINFVDIQTGNELWNEYKKELSV